ncbi:MAG: hypothetical protein M3457_05620 [Chloroflexota bacterium]|nr:hypothetical protein [Chloroflexota bacterium]
MNHSPVNLDSYRLGIREACLLLIASGFGLLMMDLGNLALITGSAVVALWIYAMIRGPRPGPVLTLVYGAGLFVTCFWWPREGWWMLAIALTWIGIALIVVGGMSVIANRVRGV